MLIAQERKQKNIIEYLIYMFQIEDMIRAADFKIDTVYASYIQQMTSNDDARLDIKQWYADLIARMQEQEILENGHLKYEVLEVVAELEYIHHFMLNIKPDEKYQELFNSTEPYIKEFREKSGGVAKEKVSDVMLCLNGLYANLLLKLKKQEISQSTTEAFKEFRKMLIQLGIYYHRVRKIEMN